MTGDITCTRPPIPWSCSREPDHDGPCAATRDINVSPNVVRIECDSYSGFTDRFGLCKEQVQAISRWKNEHDTARHIPKGGTYRYSGAIGGAYTYEFTPTSLGTVTVVRCACGEKIDVSDYPDW